MDSLDTLRSYANVLYFVNGVLFSFSDVALKTVPYGIMGGFSRQVPPKYFTSGL